MAMAELAGRWWNGKYGMPRRDIWLYHDAQRWRVEARQGNPTTAKLWSNTYADEAHARAVIHQMIERTKPDGWRDITLIVLRQVNAKRSWSADD